MGAALPRKYFCYMPNQTKEKTICQWGVWGSPPQKIGFFFYAKPDQKKNKNFLGRWAPPLQTHRNILVCLHRGWGARIFCLMPNQAHPPRKKFFFYTKPRPKKKKFWGVRSPPLSAHRNVPVCLQGGGGSAPPHKKVFFFLYQTKTKKKTFFLGGAHPPEKSFFFFLYQTKTKKKVFFLIPNQDQKKNFFRGVRSPPLSAHRNVPVCAEGGGLGKKTLWGKNWGPQRPDVSRAGGLSSGQGLAELF